MCKGKEKDTKESSLKQVEGRLCKRYIQEERALLTHSFPDSLTVGRFVAAAASYCFNYVGRRPSPELTDMTLE
jgi:hypothetical protein